jgi:hypothetical protein
MLRGQLQPPQCDGRDLRQESQARGHAGRSQRLLPGPESFVWIGRADQGQTVERNSPRRQRHGMKLPGRIHDDEVRVLARLQPPRGREQRKRHPSAGRLGEPFDETCLGKSGFRQQSIQGRHAGEADGPFLGALSLSAPEEAACEIEERGGGLHGCTLKEIGRGDRSSLVIVY